MMPLQRRRHHETDLLVLVGREEVDDAVDGLGGVDGVERREDQVTYLGGGERRGDRLVVTHLADQDHVGVLAHDVAERIGVALGVDPDLALVHDALLIGVQHLDRVLDRDDVAFSGAVDVVDHRGQRGRLARAGGTGHQDESTRLVGETPEDLREAEFGDAGALGGDTAQGDSDAATLMEDVDPETADTADRVGEVELVAVLEALALRQGHHALGKHPGLIRIESGQLLHDDEASREPDRRRAAYLDVEIRASPIAHDLQQAVDIRHRCVSSPYAVARTPPVYRTRHRDGSS